LFNGETLVGGTQTINASQTADVTVKTYLVDTSGGNVTLTLDVTNAWVGKRWDIKKIDAANELIIVGEVPVGEFTARTIDDEVDGATLTAIQDALTIEFDGVNFKIL
jgi:hypothetical protein